MISFPVSRPLIGQTEKNLVRQVLDAGWLTHGPLVEEFEHKFAQQVGAAYAVAVSSGTTALHLALAALGITAGDEVIVPNLTFVATANAVSYLGAKPVFVDVDPRTWCISIPKIQEKITSKTVGILPVHLYGVTCDIPLMLSRYPRLSVVEDSCEALGSPYIGTYGEMGVFSFYGNKVITTGEGGMIVTNDLELRDRLHHLRGQAMTRERYFHDEVGFNYRMTSVAAAIGIAQLAQINRFLGERDVIFDTYRAEFHNVLRCLPSGAAPWVFTILLPKGVDRSIVSQLLLEEGIETRPMFVPMHRLPMHADAGADADFPVSVDLYRRGLSLPTYVGLDVRDVLHIAHRVLGTIEAVGGASCLNSNENE
jgi:perosamine synthetase